MPKFIVHCLSGGMDSVVAAYYLQTQGCKVHAFMLDYKQRHVQELQFGKGHCARLGILWTVVEIPMLKGSTLTDGSGGVVVPNRNAILLSLAVNLAVGIGADTVTYACNAGDAADFPDCRIEFVRAFNAMIKAAEIPVEVCAPFIDKAKWEIADIGRQLGVNMDDTWSCYRGGEKPCGQCPACIKRAEALAPRVITKGMWAGCKAYTP